MSDSNGWCLLRKIKLHPEVATFAYCHHWVHKEPSLPIVDQNNLSSEKQLDFDGDLIIN